MIDLGRVYSFLGRSTGILGHNNINIGGQDESDGESREKGSMREGQLERVKS